MTRTQPVARLEALPVSRELTCLQPVIAFALTFSFAKTAMERQAHEAALEASLARTGPVQEMAVLRMWNGQARIDMPMISWTSAFI